jgi:hypothetical protein
MATRAHALPLRGLRAGSVLKDLSTFFHKGVAHGTFSLSAPCPPGTATGLLTACSLALEHLADVLAMNRDVARAPLRALSATELCRCPSTPETAPSGVSPHVTSGGGWILSRDVLPGLTPEDSPLMGR